jgi:molecular chaperone GrpE
MDTSKQFAIQSFAKQLLDVADNLSRALESVPADALDKKEENALLVTLVEGVRMTDQQLQKVFGANKIVKVGWL